MTAELRVATNGGRRAAHRPPERDRDRAVRRARPHAPTRCAGLPRHADTSRSSSPSATGGSSDPPTGGAARRCATAAGSTSASPPARPSSPQSCCADMERRAAPDVDPGRPRDDVRRERRRHPSRRGRGRRVTGSIRASYYMAIALDDPAAARLARGSSRSATYEPERGRGGRATLRSRSRSATTGSTSTARSRNGARSSSRPRASIPRSGFTARDDGRADRGRSLLCCCPTVGEA